DEQVGGQRGEPPQEESVLAVLAPAGDEIVPLVELGDEARDVVRIVLARGGRLPDDGRAVVRATVVDRDDLERLPHSGERFGDLVEEGDEVVALVVDGKNDADVHAGGAPLALVSVYHGR